MRIVFFYPSLLSDWNNASATGLRGVAMELLLRGHEVAIYEPRGGDSLAHVLATYGHGPVARFHAAYPGLASRRYDPATLNLDAALAEAALVIVHDETDPALMSRLAEHRARCGDYNLLLHATHGGAFGPEFDAMLTAGSQFSQPPNSLDAATAIRWPAAADTRLFKPLVNQALEGDVVWVGNCPDDARLDELQEYFLRPVQRLGLRARVYGAVFTPAARQAIAQAGVQFGGWIPDFELPAIFAAFRAVVQLPPRAAPGCPDPYLLPALACGRPVLSAAWDDADQLLRPGRDYAVARDGQELTSWLARVLADRQLAATLAQHGRQAVLADHTAAHRASTLLGLAQAVPAGRLAVWPAAFAAAQLQPTATH